MSAPTEPQGAEPPQKGTDTTTAVEEKPKARRKRTPKEAPAVSPKKPKRIEVAETAEPKSPTRRGPAIGSGEGRLTKGKIRVVVIESEGSSEELAAVFKKVAEIL